GADYVIIRVDTKVIEAQLALYERSSFRIRAGCDDCGGMPSDDFVRKRRAGQTHKALSPSWFEHIFHNLGNALARFDLNSLCCAHQNHIVVQVSRHLLQQLSRTM